MTDFGEVAAHVNERGQVLVDSGDMPYVWTDGEVAELPVPNWEAVDLDDRGRVLVRLTGTDSALWEDGDLTPITGTTATSPSSARAAKAGVSTGPARSSRSARSGTSTARQPHSTSTPWT